MNRKWKIGDKCWRPWRQGQSYGGRMAGDIGGWSPGTVVALRPKKDAIIVVDKYCKFEYEHPFYELKEKYPRGWK